LDFARKSGASCGFRLNQNGILAAEPLTGLVTNIWILKESMT